MRDLEILSIVINEAINKGYDVMAEWGIKPENLASYIYEQNLTYKLIFNHTFAEKFWGETSEEYEQASPMSYSHWQWRLQILALQADPLIYMENYVNF